MQHADKARILQHRLRTSTRRGTATGVLTTLFAGGLCGALFLATNVDTSLTTEDIVAIRQLGADSPCMGAKGNFERELACVAAIQRAQLSLIPDRDCVPQHMSQEPLSAVEYGIACCFTRSRLIEKALDHYGFAVRHVSMHVLRFPIIGYLMPADSHAASEVRTSRGWMLVGSLQDFRAVTREGYPLTAVALRKPGNFSSLVKPPEDDSFYRQPYTTVYGLYSRHGQFYPPYVPLPDIAWSQMGYNFE